MSRRSTTAPAGDGKPGKQIASENLPSRHARTTITSGDPINRSLGNYAKNATPVDLSGAGMIGYNLHSMGRN